MFYLVNEAEHKGKGANTVTSFLHNHFQYHGYREEHVKLHMDNCSGQNKNNTVIWYMLFKFFVKTFLTCRIFVTT